MGSYYDENASLFIASTIDVDMSLHYQRFLSYLGKGARILDAGCGSGRDSLHFMKLGYEVEAFDASAAMARQTESLIGKSVRILLFQDMDYENAFDGIWASASLLHVPRCQMQLVLSLLHRALKAEGILYCSFKDRPADYMKDGRIFTCYGPKSLRALVDSSALFSIADMYSTFDSRPDRQGEGWVNAVLRKR